MQHTKETFHLFGSLRMSPPQDFLPPEDLAQVNNAITYIRGFQKKGPSTIRVSWNIDIAHRRLVAEEMAWWKSKGVERPEEYIVRPSGSLNATVTCLLFNPTFSVSDPCVRETFDTTNATIAQMERVGFTPENALFIDQVARREISDNVRITYPEELWQIHERFLREVWANMKATVVVCWGSAVRKRLLGDSKNPGWFQSYEILRLWGRYSGIELFLELSSGKESMKRFVLFVKHPSFFFFIQSDLECARRIRKIHGRPQDLALEIVAKLGCIRLEPGFYESSPNLRASLSVPHEVTMRREGWKGEAAAQLRRAFPGVETSKTKSHRIRGNRRKDQEMPNAIVEFISSFRMGEVCVDGPKVLNIARDPTSLETINKYQQCRRLQIIESFRAAVKEIILMLEPSVVSASGSLSRQDIESCLTIMDDIEDVHEWGDLPTSIKALIHDQSGLRFDGDRIDSRRDLEMAYRLLHNFVPRSTESDPEMLAIVNLALSVLLAYGRMICRPRNKSVIDMLILRDAPYDILSRKCGYCGRIVLDDPFPYWSKADPNTYVSWAVLDGCGRADCEGKYPSLRPLRRDVKWSAAVVKRLQKLASDQDDLPGSQKHINWLLRNGKERGDLPDEVEFRCRNCPHKIFVKAKWTIHPQAKLVIPTLQCGRMGHSESTQGCGKKGNWAPTGRFQEAPTIYHSNLSRTFSEFKRRGCDLRYYPRIGSVIFSDKDYSFRIAELKELKASNRKAL